MKKKLYLSSWINFGKYRREPSILKKILDTEYLKLKEEDARYVLPTVGG